MAPVLSISAAWMRRWRLPQPNWTRLPSVRRRNGILRATAACTIEPVLGPKRTSSSRSRNCVSAPHRSNGVSSSAARHSASASASAKRPTASSVYSTTTWKMPGSRVCVVRLNVTGQPACACNPSAASSSTCAIGILSSWPVGCSALISGKRARKRTSKPEKLPIQCSASLQLTTASIAVWWLQRLGPRNARMRDTSINQLS